MKRVVFAVTFCLAGASAFGVTLKDLNIARDPGDLEGAIYGTTLYTLNLRSGPGLNFPKVGFVPEGAKVPISGWIDVSYGDGFWFRTRYRGEKGWLCSAHEGTRLVERDGGPIFKVSVAVDKLKFSWEKDPGLYEWEEIWLPRGEELEFLALRGSEGFSPEAEYFDFLVKYGEKTGHIDAYGNEKYARLSVEPCPGDKSTWFVDCPSELLDLSLVYYRAIPWFEFIGPEERRRYYSGPGFGYEKNEYILFHDGVLFLADNWGLIRTYDELTWVYLGTDEEPNVRMTTDLAGGECPLPDNVDPATVGDTLYIKMSRDLWPSNRRIYLTLHAPYFCEFKETGVIDFVDIYQPPGSTVPVFSAPAGGGEGHLWHETYLLTYGLSLPKSVNINAPFRAVARMHYEGAQKFEVALLCNAEG